MKISKKNTSNEKARDYYLSIVGNGMELVMGTISDRFSDYWSVRSASALNHYMFSEERIWRDAANDIDMPGLWHETDDLGHANGPLTNVAKVTVLDEDGKNLLRLEGWEELDDCLDITTTSDVRSKKVRKQTGVIKLARHAKHDMDFIIKSDKPFDPELLKLEQVKIDGLAIIDTVSYDDEVLDWVGWGTIWQGDSTLLLPRKKAA